MIQPISDKRFFVPVLAALILLAWATLWLWGQSPFARYLSHHSLETVRGNGLLALVFIAGWAIMIVAMMLPTSLPLLVLFEKMLRQRSDRLRLVALLIVGYVGVWTLFGALIYAGDSVIHALVDSVPWLDANAWVISAGTLAIAGIYQFSPLKYLCLDKCRSPLSFIVEHWSGGQQAQNALRLGIHHGLFCLGCCWALMLLSFAIGVGSLGWMLALGAIMAVEKNVAWGRRISVPLGIVLIAWCLVLALSQGSLG